MTVRFHPHATQRMRERGATPEQVNQTVELGQATAAKFGRTRFSIPSRTMRFGMENILRASGSMLLLLK